jgi:hypothetical protein
LRFGEKRKFPVSLALVEGLRDVIGIGSGGFKVLARDGATEGYVACPGFQEGDEVLHVKSLKRQIVDGVNLRLDGRLVLKA